MKTLLIDGDFLLKRGDKGAKWVVFDQQKRGALYNFVFTIKGLITTFNITKVVVFWDSHAEKWRKQKYPFYKDHRDKEVDEDFLYQKQRIKQYLEELFIRQVESGSSEADDTIAYYVQNTDEECIIYTGDRDLCQLINPRTKLYFPDKKILMDQQNFSAFFKGLRIENFVLQKILIGCTTDNVAGIKGLGEKTLHKQFPQFLTETLSKEKFLEIVNEQKETKQLKIHNNILYGETKNGEYGFESLYDLNRSLVDLSNPVLDEDIRLEVESVLNQELNPDGRSMENLYRMFIEDGIDGLIPKSEDGWFNWFKPFNQIIEHETIKL